MAKKSRTSRKEPELSPLKDTAYCPECGSSNIIYSRISDRIICQDCTAIVAGALPRQG